jgi:hypothetical protein
MPSPHLKIDGCEIYIDYFYHCYLVYWELSEWRSWGDTLGLWVGAKGYTAHYQNQNNAKFPYKSLQTIPLSPHYPITQPKPNNNLPIPPPNSQKP